MNRKIISFGLIFALDIALSYLAIRWFSQIHSSVVGGVLVDHASSPLFQILILIQILTLAGFAFLSMHENRSVKPRRSLISKNWIISGIEKRVLLLIQLFAIVKLFWVILARYASTAEFPSLKILAVIIISTTAFFYTLSNGQSTNLDLPITSFLVFTASAIYVRTSSPQLAKSFLILGFFFVLISFSFQILITKSKYLHRTNNLLILSLWIFVLSSKIAGLVNLHAFESAQYANSTLVSQGQLPFRDFQVEHGIWQDCFSYWIGGKFAGPSFFDMQLGYTAFIHPLELIIFFAPIYLMIRNLQYVLLGTLFVEIAPQLFSTNSLWQSNLVLLPALIFLLRKAYETDLKKLWSIFFASIVLSLSLILNSEFIYVLCGTFLEILLLGYFRNWNIRKIIKLELTLVFGTISPLVFLLAPIGLLIPYVKHFMYMSSGFYFAWGSVFHPNLGLAYTLLCIVTLLLILLFVVLLIKGLYIQEVFFPLGGPLFLAIGLFLKFLQWPDWHIQSPFNVLILIIAIIFGLRVSDKEKNPSQPRSLIWAGVFGSAVLISSASIVSGGEVPHPYNDPGSFNSTTQVYVNRIHQVGKSFQQFMAPHEVVFDFANEPVSWFGLNSMKTMGISKILNFASKDSQEYVIQRLEATKTEFVIWGGEFGYWNWPFNGNVISKYLISEYILNNFEPVALDGNYVLMQRKNQIGRHGIPSAVRKFQTVTCDYGFSGSRFIAPVQLTTKSMGILSPSKPIYLGPQSRVLRIESVSSGELSLKNMFGGSIKMRIVGKSKNEFFVGGCPAVHYQSNSGVWTVEGMPDAKFTVFSS